MMKIRLAMNGVLPMRSPVAGSRSGAPLGSVSSSTITTMPSRPYSEYFRPRASAASASASASPVSSDPTSAYTGSPMVGSYLPEARLDHALR